jgi:hypothetical protein
MPMIDVYATTGTFADKHPLAQQLAAAVVRGEQLARTCRFKPPARPFPRGRQQIARSRDEDPVASSYGGQHEGAP